MAIVLFFYLVDIFDEIQQTEDKHIFESGYQQGFEDLVDKLYFETDQCKMVTLISTNNMSRNVIDIVCLKPLMENLNSRDNRLP